AQHVDRDTGPLEPMEREYQAAKILPTRGPVLDIGRAKGDGHEQHRASKAGIDEPVAQSPPHGTAVIRCTCKRVDRAIELHVECVEDVNRSPRRIALLA